MAMKKTIGIFLAISMLLMTAGVSAIPAGAAEDIVWGFQTAGNTEGWTRFGTHTISVGNGAITLTRSAAGDGAMYSPELSLDTSAYRYVIFGAKSNAAVNLKIYFKCGADAYREANTFVVPVTAGSVYKEYIVDLSNHAGWSGTFKQFMFNLQSNAAVDFDYIKMATSNTPPENETAQEWTFTSGTENWTRFGTHTISAENGAITLTRSAAGDGAMYSPELSLDTSVYKYLIFGAKSNAAVDLKIYFKCGAGVYSEANTFVVPVTAGSVYKEYIVNLSNHAGWTGFLKQFMVNLQSNGAVDFDYIKLTNTHSPPASGIRVFISSTFDTITTPNGTVTLTAQVTSDETLSDYGVVWRTDTVNAAMTKNPDGSLTLTGKINGLVTVKAISRADGKTFAERVITITGQDNKAPIYDLKVMLFGNSILKHAPNSGLGWTGDWGMAASAREKDYVHRLMDHYVQNKFGTIDYALNAVAPFENAVVAQNPYDYTAALLSIKTAVETYKPDIVNLQMGENVSAQGLTAAHYANALGQLVQTIQTASPGVKIMLCAPFWGGAAKMQGLESVAQQYSLPVADLSVLNTNENKALGLFAHDGVAMHPGDLGMDNIAKLIFANMDDIIMECFEPEYEILPMSIMVTSPSDVITQDAGTLRMNAQVLPAQAGQAVIWSVDNNDLAQISGGGLLTAKNNGVVTVSAKSALNDVLGTKTITISGQSTPYTVTYLAGTGDTVTDLPAANPLAKGLFELSAQRPQRTAYQFVGWSLRENGDTVAAISVTGDVSVCAVWRKASAWEFDQPGYLEGITVQNGFNVFVQGGKLMAIATGTNPATGNVLKILSPQLSLDASSHGIFAVRMQSTAFQANTKVRITILSTGGNHTYEAPVTSGYETQYAFDISDCTGTITGFIIEPTNIDCTVYTDFIRFGSGATVTYHANTTDTVTGMPAADYAFDGIPYQISAAKPLRNDYKLAGWSLTPNGAPVDDAILVAGDTALYAVWRYNDSWYFDNDGDAEGWSGTNVTDFAVTGGALTATALNRGSAAAPDYDPIVRLVSPAKLDTNLYGKVKARMEYTLLPGVTASMFQIYFTTDDVPNESESASVRITLNGNSSNGWIDIVANMSENSLWKNSRLKSLRIDPIAGGGSFRFDYIRVIADAAVTFHANGGSGTMPGIPSAIGDTMILPECGFLKPGYAFTGWSDGQEVIPAGANYTVTGQSVILTAVWRRIHTISFDANAQGAPVSDLPSAQTAYADTVLRLSALSVPERQGFEFLGWSADGTEAGIVTEVTVSEDLVLKAVWSKIIPVFGKMAVQVSKGATVHDDSVTVRLLVGLNSLKHASAGFIVATGVDLDKDGYSAGDGCSVALSTKTVYTMVTADNASVYAASLDAEYLLAIEITDFPKENYEKEFRVQSFVLPLDGSAVYTFGEKVITTVAQIIEDQPEE